MTAVEEPGKGALSVLLVDDEREYRLLAGSFLQDQGWTVYLAEHGQEAIDQLRRAKMDIIVSDIYMPVMDGLKLHRSIRQMPDYATIPFLFVSAYDDKYTMDAVKNPKIDAFFRKGRTLNEMREWILYLTTPIDKRPAVHPGEKYSRMVMQEDRSKFTSRNPKRR